MRSGHACLLWLGVAVCTLVLALNTHSWAGDTDSRKVVIVTGIDYPGHKWKETAPVLAELLRKDPRLKVGIVETPAFLASERLSDYDVAVLHFMNWETPDPGPKARQNLVDFTRNGGGLVAVHFACGAFQGWPEFEKLVGRVWDPNLRGHDPHGAFEVRMIDVGHPITRGLKAFETVDELYTCLTGTTPIKVLAEAKSKVDGKNYPMAFVLQYGKGRVFHSVLGHDVQAFAAPGVGELFRRGCAWAAGLPTSSAAVSAVSTTGILPVAMQGQDGDPKRDISRLGTHAPDTHGRDTHATIAFIAGMPSHGADCHGWDKTAAFVKSCLQNATNIEPPQIDIHLDGWPQDAAALDKVDAVVFFADGREHHPLAVPGRMEKIRELARQGKGIAFLHYSVDPPEGGFKDFLDWMGGAYEVGVSQNPINVVKVTPVDNGHPITRGCGGYVAEDEWYFDIGLRPNDANVVPLLTGKLPPRAPQDKVLAWAYTRPDGGRGFGFTGGHFDKNWHMEPFRKMVLNGILWIAKAEVPETGVASMQPWRFVSIPDFVNVDLTYPQPGWEETLDYVLKAIKAENPEFVLVAGDLVMGHWPDKEFIEKMAAIYYPAWMQRMADHGLKFYAAVGDHEIGDNPWPAEKTKLVYTFKKQFQKHLRMPLNGPLRMKGTAYWFIHENALFVALDVFEKGSGPQGGIVPQVTGEQLQWLEQTLTDNPGVEHIVVMGHTPVLGPVARESSSGLMLDGGRESPLWQTLKKHRADLYLCGEVHAITCTQADGVLQIAHGGLFGYNPKVNYLVATVHPDRIDLELKEIAILNEGGKLPQTGDNRPREIVRIPDEARQKGFITIGTATLCSRPEGATLTNTTGCFDR
jgi:type 1 glutamine amidotransferase